MSSLSRHRALALLDQCTGEHIWSPEYCAQRGVPAVWVEELADAHESGFRTDSQTLYTDQGITNQYFGVHDLKLALRLGAELGVDIDRITTRHIGRRSIVSAIKDAVSDEE